MTEESKGKVVSAVVKAAEGIGAVSSETAKAIALVTGFCEKVMGEPLRELGGIFTDQFAIWRLRHRLRLVEQVEELHKRWKVKQLRRVAPKLALPLIEAASLEEEDDLRLRYACLLANYSDSDSLVEPQPAFKQMLEGMSARDLVVLRAMYDETQRPVTYGSEELYARGIANTKMTLPSIRQYAKLDEGQALRSLDNLVRLCCVVLSGASLARAPGAMDWSNYYVSSLGEALLLACDPDLRASPEGER